MLSTNTSLQARVHRLEVTLILIYTHSKVLQPSRPSNFQTFIDIKRERSFVAPESNSFSQYGAPVTGLHKEQ